MKPPILSPRRLAALGLVVLCLGQLATARAWSLTIDAASPRVFLHVGTGTLDSANATVNLVSVNLSAAQLLSGAPQPMTSNSTQARSLYNGNVTCSNPASQVMVGASFRRNGSPQSDGRRAVLGITFPANLTNTTGDTMPFSEISWTASDPDLFPAGRFDGSLTAYVGPNTYVENCYSFSYANSELRAPGTYTGTVTYTLTIP